MNTQSPLPAPSPATLPRKRRRRWPKVLLGLFVLLLLGAWFVPAIVAKTTLRNWAARKALADLKGTVEVGGASAGWFSPIELRDVTVKDAQGRTLLAVPKVTSSKSLYALLKNSSDAGEFVVEKPAIEVVCEGNSTNLEDALAKFLNDESPPKPTRTALALKVSGGRLTIHDAGKGWNFDAVEVAVNIPASRTEALTAKVSAGGPGELEADVSLGERGQVKLVATGFPLDALAPVLRRVEPGVSVGGKLTAGVTASGRRGKSASTAPSPRVTSSCPESD
jgi:translocation and assembly module TamB